MNWLKQILGLNKTYFYEPDLPYILVPVEIVVGERLVETQMILDTGATLTVLSHDLADILGLEPVDQIETTTANGDGQATVAYADQISALGHYQQDEKILISHLPDEPMIGGLLGLSFFEHKTLKINFQKNTIQLR